MSSETTGVTNADFAEAVGYMAATAAKWVAESMTFREEIANPMHREPLDRFICEMRDRLTRLEDRANGK